VRSLGQSLDIHYPGYRIDRYLCRQPSNVVREHTGCAGNVCGVTGWERFAIIELEISRSHILIRTVPSDKHERECPTETGREIVRFEVIGCYVGQKIKTGQISYSQPADEILGGDTAVPDRFDFIPDLPDLFDREIVQASLDCIQYLLIVDVYYRTDRRYPRDPEKALTVDPRRG